MSAKTQKKTAEKDDSMPSSSDAAPAKNQPKAANNGTGGLLPESENLDKIRTILFGAQSREFEKRMKRLEDHFNREIDSMNTSIRRRLDELEGYIKSESEAFGKRLSAEQRQREADDEETNDELKKNVKGLKSSLNDLEMQLSDTERALRASLLEQSNTLSDELQRKADHLTALMQESDDTLRDDKTDRLALADLFEEVSGRLRGDFELPLGE